MEQAPVGPGNLMDIHVMTLEGFQDASRSFWVSCSSLRFGVF